MIIYGEELSFVINVRVHITWVSIYTTTYFPTNYFKTYPPEVNGNYYILHNYICDTNLHNRNVHNHHLDVSRGHLQMQGSWNGKVISSNISIGMWLLIYAGID